MKRLILAFGLILWSIQLCHGANTEPPKFTLPEGFSVVKDAEYAKLDGLAEGSKEAQERQKAEVERLGIPLKIRHDKTGIELVYVPAGEFIMGSNDGHKDERPAHKVILSKGFYVGVTEVTQKQWQTVMGQNPSLFKGADLPVEKMHLGDCMYFCEKTGFILPSEAQWEYACRAGTFGDFAGPLDDMGWYYENAGDNHIDSEGKKELDYISCQKLESNKNRSHPVAKKKPNAWGLYDMHGNVWEWCGEPYDNYPKTSTATTDPRTLPSNELPFTVFRGGYWGELASSCRSANRNGGGPSFSAEKESQGMVGFRVILPIKVINPATKEAQQSGHSGRDTAAKP